MGWLQLGRARACWLAVALLGAACGDDDGVTADGGTVSMDAAVDQEVPEADADPEADGGSASTVTVTPAAGGMAALPLDDGGEASVEVPPDAVETETEVEVAVAEPSGLAPVRGTDAALVSQPVAFTPHGTTFTTPVTIRLSMPGGVPNGTVMLRLDDESDADWELVASSVEGNAVLASVTRFSIYALATGPVCHQADPDTDGDGICDSEDPCAAPDDDSDGDGICDSVDPCEAPSDDTDGNGICDDTEARITGNVATSDGTPLASVDLDLYSSDQTFLETATTDESGDYFFGGLVADTYGIGLAHSDPTRCYFGQRNEVPVAIGEIVTADLEATPCP